MNSQEYKGIIVDLTANTTIFVSSVNDKERVIKTLSSTGHDVAVYKEEPIIEKENNNEN